MSAQWAEVARRGQLALTLLTPARARAEGCALRAGYSLIGILEPDGAEGLLIGFRDAARVAQWCEEMLPHRFAVVGVAGENTEALRAAIAELRQRGAEHLN